MSEGLICTRCGVETYAVPELTSMPYAYAKELVEGWMCTDCLDLQDDADEARAAERNLEQTCALRKPPL